MPIRDYSGNAIPSTLALEFDGVSLSATLDVADNWPLGGVNGKFVVTFARDTDREERALVNDRSGNVLNFASIADRGVDDTAVFSHLAGTTVDHTFSGIEAQEANQHIFNTALDQHLQYMRADGVRHDLTARHPGGTVVPTAAPINLATGAANALGSGTNLAFANHGHGVPVGMPVSVGTALAQGATGNFADAGHTHNLSAAAISAFLPAGVIAGWGALAAPAGWLLCNGALVSRATFASLFAAIGTTYGVGDGATTFGLPNFQQRTMLGKAAAGTGANLGDTGGTIDHVHSLENPNAVARITMRPSGGFSPIMQRVSALSWAPNIDTSAGGNAAATGEGNQADGAALAGNTDSDNFPFQVANYIIKT